MRTPLDMGTIGRLALRAETPEQQRRFAQRLITWAAERHPADAVEITPAALLVEAGQVLELLGDSPNQDLKLVLLAVVRDASAAPWGSRATPLLACAVRVGPIAQATRER